MQKLLLLASFNIVTIAAAENVSQFSDLLERINSLMRTDFRYELSNGNTYPAICVLWGMNFWTPQTSNLGNGWQYQHSTSKIRGLNKRTSLHDGFASR